MTIPTFSVFLFYPNDTIVNFSNSRDSWTIRTQKTSTTDSYKTCDAYIKLVKRADGSQQPVKTLAMSFFLINDITFVPGVEVKLTFASSGNFLFGIRLVYLNDQSALEYFEPKAFFIPGDGYNTQFEDFSIVSDKNKYLILTKQFKRIHTLYTVAPWISNMTQVDLQANFFKDITPKDISCRSRYMHVFYFESTHRIPPPISANMASSASSASSSANGAFERLCTICITNEADHLFSPCNHVCICYSCKSAIADKKCPVCRRTFANIQRVFFTWSDFHLFIGLQTRETEFWDHLPLVTA